MRLRVSSTSPMAGPNEGSGSLDRPVATPLRIVRDAKGFLEMCDPPFEAGRRPGALGMHLTPLTPLVLGPLGSPVGPPREPRSIPSVRSATSLAALGTLGSAPPTRGCRGWELSPSNRMLSPPRTDPPRRQKRQKAFGTGRVACLVPAAPDSPMPLPPGTRLRAEHWPDSLEVEEALEFSQCVEAITVSISVGCPEELSENAMCQAEFTRDPGTGKAITELEESCDNRRHELDEVWSATDDGTWAPDSVSPSPLSAEALETSAGSPKSGEPKDPEFMYGRSDFDYWDEASQGELSGKLSSLSASYPAGEDENDRSMSMAKAAGAMHGATCSWVRGELIGRGSLGCVWKALNRKTGQLMAVKEVMLDPSDKEKLRTLQNEVDLCKDLQHPSIVAYLGNDFIGDRLFIYLEFMAGGSVSQVLSQFGPLDESLSASYMLSIVQGLVYLHTREPPVLHRDLKGANILVGMDRTVKLSDFGCSKRMSATGMHTLRGSVPWMAPEVMRQSGYGRKADIWSLGCVLIEMCTAAAPWGKFDNCLAAMVRIAMSEEMPPLPLHASQVCQNFIRQCTRRCPDERPTAAQLLEHEFIVGGLNGTNVDESWGR